MRHKEGPSSPQYRKLAAAILFCCFFLISAGSTDTPQCQRENVQRVDPSAITSQYTQSGPLSFDSDDELMNWASLTEIEGDGTFNSPLVITGLNVTAISEPSLKLSNISETWFIFENCIFQSHLWYETLDLSNITVGTFTQCIVYGAVILNDTEFSVIMYSYITEGLYVVESLDAVIMDTWFGENANAFVFRSTNVSFYDNTFFGELTLVDGEYCYIMDNSFFSSVSDDGFANYWDSNRYADYSGTGSYVIPGSATSVDFNPDTLETVSAPTFPIGTTSPTTTTALSISIEDYILIGVICFEIGVVIMIVMMRRKATQ